MIKSLRIIQGVYWGLGTGTGAVIGGLCIQNYGSQRSFRYGGYTTLVVAFLYYFVYYIAEKYEKKT
ncbi:hypothetical protein HZS_2005 [Henneguya salminicola]|nr:hypothetical protein HZS_2005 [Henneguya salminicola]